MKYLEMKHGNSPQCSIEKKDDPVSVMVSLFFCPAVHISGSQNVYNRAKGIPDHHWPWAVFTCLINSPRNAGGGNDWDCSDWPVILNSHNILCLR